MIPLTGNEAKRNKKNLLEQWKGHQSRWSIFFNKGNQRHNIAAAILVSAFVLPSMMSVQQASATGGNTIIGSMFAETSSLKDFRSIQYMTTTTAQSMATVPCPNEGCLPVWSEAHLGNGVGSNDYWHQCGVRLNHNTAKWEVWFQWFDTSGGRTNLVSSTKPPAGTTVTLKLGVLAYTGASSVQCEASWGSTSLVLGSHQTNILTYFKTLFLCLIPACLLYVQAEWKN